MSADSSTHEVLMKLSAKADPSLTKPYQEMARLTQEASKEEEEYQKILKGRIAAYHLSLKLKEDLAKAGIGVELTEEEKYQQMLKQRIKDYETSKKLKGDLAKAGIGVEMTEEEKYQQMLKQRIKDHETSKKLKEDLAKAGIGVELTAEEKYQQMLKRRFEDHETSKRLKEDLAKAGIGVELTAEEKYQQMLKRRIEDYETAKRLKKDLAEAGIGVEMTEEEKYQRALQQRIKDYETAKRMKKDLAEAGVGEKQDWTRALANPSLLMKGAAAAAAIGFAKEMSQAIPGQRIGDYGYGRKGFGVAPEAEQRTYDTTIERLFSWVPVVGQTLAYAYKVDSKTHIREQNLKESYEAVERNQVLGDKRLGLTLQQRSSERTQARYHAMAGFSEADRKRQLAEQEAILKANQGDVGPPMRRMGGIAAEETPRQRAERLAENVRRKERREGAQERIQEIKQLDTVQGFGMNSASAQSRIWLKSQKGQLAYQEQLMRNPNAAGYNRETAMADYMAKSSYQTNRGQQEAENKRELGILAHEQKTAGKHLAESLYHREKAQAAVQTAQQNKNVPGLNNTQLQERSNALLQAQNELDRADKEAKEAIAHSMELQVRYGETLNQQNQRRLSLIQAESQRLQSVVQMEKEREMGRREHFGLMNPLQQRAALGIAKKLNQGGKLTQKEIEFAQGMPEIFGERLKNIARDRTGKGSAYQKLREMLPELGQRQKTAEKELAKINQQFNVLIQLNEKELGDQIQKKLLPDLRKAMEQVKKAFNDEMQRAANQAEMQHRAATGKS